MMRRASLLAVAVLLWCVPPLVAFADPDAPVPVRIGNHPGFGRVVFDMSGRTDYHVTQQGQRVVVQFDGDMTIGSASGVPHNVLSLTGGKSQAEVVVAPGTVVHDWRLGDRVIIDVLDQDAAPGGASPGAQRNQSASPRMPAVPPVTATQPPSPKPSAKPTASVPAPTVAAAAPPPQAAAPAPMPLIPAAKPAVEPVRTAPVAASVPAMPASPPAQGTAEPTASDAPQPPTVVAPQAPVEVAAAGGDARDLPPPSTLIVPIEDQVGVAAFRRGTAALVVFDRRLAIDTARLRDDPVFGSASVQTFSAATVIRIPIEAGTVLSLSLEPHAWRISASIMLPNLRSIRVVAADGRLALSAASPGMVVSITDPGSGVTLLVGTQRQAGQGIAVRRRAAEFLLLPTWQGVVVEPVADSLTLRPVQDGFVLTGGAGGLAVSPAADPDELLEHAAGLTRRFDFPSMPALALAQRLNRQVDAAAETPALARGSQRRAAAQTMIALGMGVEAQSLLLLAAADDPHEASTPENAALASIAALLGHRPDEASGLGDERLSGTDDVALWRAVRLASLQENSPGAAQVLAATMPLLLTYPPDLRVRLLPLVAETLVGGGETAAAAALLARHETDPSLDFARALLKQAQGDDAAALAIYDRLTQSADQSLHARAAVRAIEARLANGSIDAKQAASRLDKLLYSWRGDQQEKAMRERLAALKAQTGAWRAALALLRDTEVLFPDDKAAIHAKLTEMFAALLRGDTADALAPLELVALVEENADLLPDGPQGEALEARLADRLLALDLPKRAGPVLEKLMQAAPTDAGRAGLGARLGALRLREGDAAGALAALAGSAAEGLSPDLAERRTLLFADANARRGDGERALSALENAGTAGADAARATILERANDWPAAEKALTDYVAKTVPPEGTIDEGQRRTLLRLATAAARAGDDATLAALRQREDRRMGTGPLADMFRLLTAEQVHGLGDLKRAGREAALARALPDQLKGLQAPARQTP